MAVSREATSLLAIIADSFSIQLRPETANLATFDDTNGRSGFCRSLSLAFFLAADY